MRFAPRARSEVGRGPIRPDEVLSNEAWEVVRCERLAEARVRRAARRLEPCAGVSVVFETRATVLVQIQEVLRLESRGEPRRVRQEIEAYSGLVPMPGELTATVLLNGRDPVLCQRLGRELAMGAGVLWLEAPGVMVLGAPPCFDPAFEGAVHYLRFGVPSGARSWSLGVRGVRQAAPLPPSVLADVG